MSYLIATPDLLSAAATDLAGIGNTIGQASYAAAAPTTAVISAADEISMQIAALFGAHGQSFQAVSSQAALFHDQFVQALTTGASSYASAEAASQNLLNLVNAPTQVTVSMAATTSKLCGHASAVQAPRHSSKFSAPLGRRAGA